MRTLGDILKTIPYFSEYFTKSSLNPYNILGEQFAKYTNGSRTVSLKNKRTVVLTGCAKRTRTLFKQLLADRISETQTPDHLQFTKWGGDASLSYVTSDSAPWLQEEQTEVNLPIDVRILRCAKRHIAILRADWSLR